MRKPLDAVRRRLEDEQVRLRQELGQWETLPHDNLGYGNHMADDATEAFEQAKDLALRQNLERLLEQVEGALARFTEGTYGLCEKCGEAIDPARLKALPHATLCVRCQQHYEQR
jgi:DnaK suppressor protein